MHMLQLTTTHLRHVDWRYFLLTVRQVDELRTIDDDNAPKFVSGDGRRVQFHWW